MLRRFTCWRLQQLCGLLKLLRRGIERVRKQQLLVMRRRTFVAAAGAGLAGVAFGRPVTASAPAKTFLVAHGAWSAGWSWKKVRPLFGRVGHQLFTPTYTGLGEREHLATPQINLETHVQDLLGVIKYEDLSDVHLIAHSYGGMVATGVADRIPERITQIIYLDAFVPRSGQALLDLVDASAARRMRDGAKAGDGWRVPPNPIPPDTSAEDRGWIERFRMPQPLSTFESPLRLERGEPKIPRAYIYCQRATPADTFRPFAERARKEGWAYREIDASHSAQVTAPQALAALVQSIAV